MGISKEEIKAMTPASMTAKRWATAVSVYAAHGGEDSREAVQRTPDRIPFVNLSALPAFELGVVMAVVFNAYEDGRRKGRGELFSATRRMAFPGLGYNAKENKDRLRTVPATAPFKLR
jgi:hypothetical protein